MITTLLTLPGKQGGEGNCTGRRATICDDFIRFPRRILESGYVWVVVLDMGQTDLRTGYFLVALPGETLLYKYFSCSEYFWQTALFSLIFGD